MKTCIWSSEEILQRGEKGVRYKRTVTAQATTDWSFFRKRNLVRRGFVDLINSIEDLNFRFGK